MAKCIALVFGLLALSIIVYCRDSKYDKKRYFVNKSIVYLKSCPNKGKVLEYLAHKNGMSVEYKYDYGRSFVPVERGPQKRSLRSFDIFRFNSYKVIKNYIEDLPEAVPQLVTVQEIGRSFEGRILYIIKISLNPESNNPIILVDAGMEGRDWVGPAMAMYLIHRLTSDNRTLSRELHGVDWYILPVVNPDGYVYSRSHPSNRLWKKTRSTTASEQCLGADVNRNFDFNWGVSGVSQDPCTDNYCGSEPFSESETQLVGNIMSEHRKRLKLYVSLHSYGQYLVYPWSYTNNLTITTERRLASLASMVSDSVVRADGVPFKVMSAGAMLEPVAGSSDDYAFGILKVPYSYRMLLTEGFEYTFPEELLRIVLPQYYEAFRTFSIQIGKEFGNL